MDRRSRLQRTALTHGAAGAILSLPLLVVATVLQHIPGTCDQLLPTVAGAWLLTTLAAAMLPTALVAALPPPMRRAGFRALASAMGAALTVLTGAIAQAVVHETLVSGPSAALGSLGPPAEPVFTIGLVALICVLSIAPWGATEWSMRRA